MKIKLQNSQNKFLPDVVPKKVTFVSFGLADSSERYVEKIELEKKKTQLFRAFKMNISECP